MVRFFIIMRSHEYHNLYDTTRWRKLRAAHLASNPDCIYCLQAGILRQANIVDHIKPHKGDITLFYSSDNLQSLCKRCHDSTKKKQETSGYIQGHSVDGAPLDKNHHWNK
jgi:5-methylcytosine-specific restriction protein A